MKRIVLPTSAGCLLYAGSLELIARAFPRVWEARGFPLSMLAFELERDGNLIEAGFWFVVTLFLLFKATRARGRLRKIFAVLTVAFFFFSLSDVVESRTGAWWTPPWLLGDRKSVV